MKFSGLLSALALTSTAVFAVPTNWAAPWADWSSPSQRCISQDDANTIVNKYASILSHTGNANATAQALLANNYQEISDSINSLAGYPLGSVSFSGKQGYIAGVLGAPPVTGIQTIEVLVAGCNRLLWYWNFGGVGSKKYPVKGFNLFTLDNNRQVSKVNLEFNNVAWGQDTGYTVTPPPGGPIH